MLLLTLRGTPTLYYGDEPNARRRGALKSRQDPLEKQQPGRGLDEIRTQPDALEREHERLLQLWPALAALVGDRRASASNPSS
jgi:hypothetical protein